MSVFHAWETRAAWAALGVLQCWGAGGRVPTGRGRGTRPAVAGKRGRNDVERLAQRLDDIEELGDRSGPAVRDDQRQRVGVVGTRVNEVDLLAVDLSEEMRPPIEAILLRAPV